jgi:hypothetical protein
MAIEISGRIVSVQQTGYRNDSGCIAHPSLTDMTKFLCPQDGRHVAVHGPKDDVGHGPMCASHAREQVAKCLTRSCTRTVYRNGQYITEPTYR